MLGLSIIVLSFCGVAWGQNCPDGECCSGLFYARQINPLWTLVHRFNLTECALQDGSNCQKEAGTSCGSIGAASDCRAQGQCCWLRFWRDNNLDSPYDETRSWGEYLCQTIEEEAGINRLWTMDLKGQWYHCGKDNNNFWENYPDLPAELEPIPTLCCDVGGEYLAVCPEEV